jgi:hypothetical protein
MASERGALRIASHLATLADARTQDALQRARSAPAWLQERIDLAYAGRMAIGEAVTPEENARDQLAAFAVHVPKRTVPPWGAWMILPADNLEERLATLDMLVATIDSSTITVPGR